MSYLNAAHKGRKALDEIITQPEPAYRERAVNAILDGLTRDELITLGHAARELGNLCTRAARKAQS